ncbi:MAG: hypothetical protein COB02_10260 [Candidatus Cloacimonadota bacterium]|nr:MAG: hypothetical protein COB02_10260 [Candidatus Cloacimonadota bacterium]
MKLQLPTKKSTKSKGAAIIIVLLLIVMVPPVLFGLHSYMVSKTKSLAILEAHSILHQEARNALKEVEYSLIQGRWYLPKHQYSYQLHENYKSEVSVYIDEYESIQPQYVYSQKKAESRSLDHIKVYINLKYKNKELIAYGKFVISPSPLLEEEYIHGINPFNRKNIEEIPTIKKFAYQDITPKNYLVKQQKLDLALAKDRDILSNFFDNQLQKANIRSYLQTKDHKRAKRMLQTNLEKTSKRDVFKLFYILGANKIEDTPTSTIINQYLISKSKNFHFNFNQKYTPQDEKLSIIEIRNPYNKIAREEVIKELFDKTLLKTKRSAYLNRIYEFKNNRNPIVQYYQDRNIEQYISLPTNQFIDTLSGFPSGNQFKINWKATCGNFDSNGDFEDFIRYYKDFNSKKSLFQSDDCKGLASFTILNKSYKKFYHPVRLSDDKEHNIQLRYILEYYHKQVSNTLAKLVPEKIELKAKNIGGLAQFKH